MMLVDITIGCVLVIVTTFVHAAVMITAMRWIGPAARGTERPRLGRASAIAGLVLLLFLAAIVESAIWAATYRLVGALSGDESALYFSVVTFTTLGYGDVVLDDEWRLLASFEAANGIMMFGWTTALIVAGVQRVYAGSERRDV